MKENVKNVALFLIVAVLVLGGLMFIPAAEKDESNAINNEFFRIHIRANSNTDVDQRVKYEVKDAVIDALTPLLAQATSKEAALNIVSGNLDLVESAANEALSKEGYTYLSNAIVCQEYFPTRAYGNVVLESGEYDSLILNLGTGNGDNWWCVMYPPLCFVNSGTGENGGVQYQSKLLDIIKNFFGG